MRLSLRFVIPLALVLGLMAYAVVPLVDQLTLRWFVRDLDMRSALMVNTVQEPLVDLIRSGSRQRVLAFFDRLTQDERLYAVGFCGADDQAPIATVTFPRRLSCADINRMTGDGTRVLPGGAGTLHLSVVPVGADAERLGVIAMLHDMSFVDRRSEETKRYVFYFFVALGAVVSLVTVVVAQLSWRGWLHGTRALLRGEGLLRPLERFHAPHLHPLAKDLRVLMRELESEYRQRDEGETHWSPQTLRGILKADLRGDDILVVSNREPYMHERRGDKIEVRRPASGLVTALEPIMRACSGTWVAHGSGGADRETVDRNDRVAVPPEKPAYNIRRVWLSKEEEEGYYYGFSNEGLWPLCHIAHVRPVFRTSDWRHYQEVNQRFARAVVKECQRDDPIILVQDYHFALLPRMIRDQLPHATIITFWHIPWPNPETFSICPWREELLDGLLGSSILGFHTQFHCNNFVDTVDRTLEARVDRENFTVSYGNKQTRVQRYPISIDWPPACAETADPVPACRDKLRARHGLPAGHLLGVGVDRMDYTKGILERFRALERLLELEPRWRGRLSFLQIAAPSRAGIDTYQHFSADVHAMAARINERFARGGPPPIILRAEHVGSEEVFEYYRAGDFCMVTSLHDGMNLVAKEFISAREDEEGVLILSQFAGASRELPEALIVNPYDIDQCAAAIHLALTMPREQQRDRMRLMRRLVREFNVYRWAGRMLLDAASMRRRGRVLQRSQEGQVRRIAAV